MNNEVIEGMELAQQKYSTDLERYYHERDFKEIVPASDKPFQPYYPSPVSATKDLAVGVVLASGVVGGVAVVIYTVTYVMGVIAAFITAYALPIGGGFTLLVAIVIGFFGAKDNSIGETPKSKHTAPGNAQGQNITIIINGQNITTNAR